MSAAHLILLLVAAQRLAEVVYAGRNTRALLREGWTEVGAGHYPLMVFLHGGWLLSMALWVPADATIHWPPLIAFVLLQAARVWVIATLGRYWTTRIVTSPEAPLVRHGPYRFLRHPNYAIVVGEIALLPLVFGAWELALVFSALNLALLRYRLRMENQVLRPRYRLYE